MNFLTPLAFLGALLAIPIILLYMLRLRRREVTISSTFLWQQVLQDWEANTPWQRLKRNLLLFLQLIILALLVFALARPFITVPAVSAGLVTVLLDASASMNATDVEGNTRLAAARDEVLDVIETLSSGDEMTVIRVAEVPEVMISSTSDRARLRNAVNDVEVGFAEADWEAALNLAAAGASNTDDFTVLIVSDGGLPSNVGLPGIEGEIRYLPVGESGENVAITALATRSLPGETPELFAQVTNYGSTEAQIVFTLFVDGETFAAQNQTVPAGGTLPIISSALPDNFRTLRATLTQSVNSAAEDFLPVDDVAYAVSSDGGERRILLVTPGNVYVEQVLRSLPGLDTVQTDGATGIPAGYDVYLFDTIVPDTLPDGDMFFINPQADSALFSVGGESTETTNPVAETADPRMNFVDASQLNLLRFRQLSGVEWADTLMRVDGGPILVAGEIDGRQVAVLPFNLRESDLPLQITWPVIMANLMEWFTPRSTITVQDSISVGDSLIVRPPFEADTVRITNPDGDTRDLAVERETVIFAGANEPGIYTLELLANGEVIDGQPFAVNLFSELESRITPVALGDLTLEGTQIVLGEENELGQREFWPFIALLALLVLLIEWYVYHRRLRVPTVFRPVTAR